jgi:hypothetical protein
MVVSIFYPITVLRVEGFRGLVIEWSTGNLINYGTSNVIDISLCSYSSVKSSSNHCGKLIRYGFAAPCHYTLPENVFCLVMILSLVLMQKPPQHVKELSV